MLINGSEINNGNKDLYSFLKRSLNSIESNDAEANEWLTETFKNLEKVIKLQNNTEELNLENGGLSKSFLEVQKEFDY